MDHVSKDNIVILFSNLQHFYKISIHYYGAVCTIYLMDIHVRNQRMINIPPCGSHCSPHRGVFSDMFYISLWCWRAYIAFQGGGISSELLCFWVQLLCDLTLAGSIAYSQPQILELAFLIHKSVEYRPLVGQMKDSSCWSKMYRLGDFPHHTWDLS